MSHCCWVTKGRKLNRDVHGNTTKGETKRTIIPFGHKRELRDEWERNSPHHCHLLVFVVTRAVWKAAVLGQRRDFCWVAAEDIAT